MRKRTTLGLLVPSVVILHFLLHVGFSIGRAAPDLLTLAVLLAAREVEMGPGGVVGFFFGLLEDAFSVLAFGASTLALTTLGILGAGTRRLFVGDSLLFVFVYLISGKLLRDVIHWVAAGDLVRDPFLKAVVIDGGVGAVYIALIGLLLVSLFGEGRVSR
jgi:rod shape-determining protein MreD